MGTRPGVLPTYVQERHRTTGEGCHSGPGYLPWPSNQSGPQGPIRVPGAQICSKPKHMHEVRSKRTNRRGKSVCADGDWDWGGKRQQCILRSRRTCIAQCACRRRQPPTGSACIGECGTPLCAADPQRRPSCLTHSGRRLTETPILRGSWGLQVRKHFETRKWGVALGELHVLPSLLRKICSCNACKVRRSAGMHSCCERPAIIMLSMYKTRHTPSLYRWHVTTCMTHMNTWGATLIPKWCPKEVGL
jgi:hypothetical protein